MLKRKTASSRTLLIGNVSCIGSDVVPNSKPSLTSLNCSFSQKERLPIKHWVEST